MNSSLNGADSVSAEKKKRGKFNIIDALLIALAILLVCALIYMFSPMSLIKNLVNRNTRNIQYEIEFVNVDEAFIDKIKVNDQVVDGVTKSNLGAVTTVDYNTKYSEYRFDVIERDNEDGESTVKEPVVTTIEYPDRYNVIVTVTVEANYSEGVGYSVDSTRIAVGERFYLKFPEYTGEGCCVGLIEY